MAETTSLRPRTSSTTMRPRHVFTRPERRNSASARVVDSLVAPIQSARSDCVIGTSYDSELPLCRIISDASSTSIRAVRTVVLFELRATRRSFASPELSTEVLADGHDELGLVGQRLEEAVGAKLRDHRPADRCRTGRPGPTVQRREFAELVTRHLDTDEQLTPRRHGQEHTHPALEADVHAVGVVALDEQQVAGRVNPPPTEIGDHVPDRRLHGCVHCPFQPHRAADEPSPLCDPGHRR